MSMSYYKRMEMDKARDEATFIKAYQLKVEHYENNRAQNCACEICLDVVTRRFNYAKQEFDKVTFARMTAEEKSQHIANHMQAMRDKYPQVYGRK